MSFETYEELSAAELMPGLGALLVQEHGGVEYLIDARDGEAYFYDVNALSNFVADAPEIVGFDPFVDLVDLIVARASAHAVAA